MIIMIERFFIDEDMQKINEEDHQQMETFGFELFWTSMVGKGAKATYANMHNSLELMYAGEGSYTVYINGEKQLLTQGGLAFFPSNTIHSAFTKEDSGGKFLTIKLNSSVVLNLAPSEKKAMYMLQLSSCQKGQQMVFSGEELLQMGISPLVQELMVHLDTPCYTSDLQIKTKMVNIFACLLNHYTNTSDTGNKSVTTAAYNKIFQTVHYINEHFDEEITTQKCAVDANMSYTYFSQIFKTIVGKTFVAYLNEVRINHAEELLLLTDKPITEICRDCGFNDVSYFISKFKASRGISPNNFRKYEYKKH